MAELVVICLATHNPPPEMFEAQLESIRAQTYGRWVCLISDDASEPEAWNRIERSMDDPRFTASRSVAHLGFYRNFERALSLVPAEAAYVALSDQDDRWHPDKLATLVDALARENAQLAFSDLRAVTPDGRVVAESYWHDRGRNVDDLGSLLLSNTVTGAASLFRRDLLDDALPFPPDEGNPFHDHWLACVALARGRIAFVDRPLLDYVQHGENVLGSPAPSPDLRGGVLHALGRLLRDPRRRLRNTAAHAAESYCSDVVRLQHFAGTLDHRLGGRLRPEHAADVRRVARLDSARSFLWLLGRSARDVRGRSATLGVENQLLKGIAWRRWQAVSGRLARRAR